MSSTVCSWKGYADYDGVGGGGVGNTGRKIKASSFVLEHSARLVVDAKI